MTIKPRRIERYFDTHEVPSEEALTQTFAHFYTIQYLYECIRNLYYENPIGILSRVNICLNTKIKEGPDIAVIDGLVLTQFGSKGKNDYHIGKHGPPPRVVFEITSPMTSWRDREEKPARYAAMGIKEYFVYDPDNRSSLTGLRGDHNRLMGWRKIPASAQHELLVKDEAGRLWSEELASWLVVEPKGLRLYTIDGQLRLTELEAYPQQIEAARQKADQLAEMLRKLGHNPDELI